MEITKVDIQTRTVGSHFNRDKGEREDITATELHIWVDEWPKLSSEFRFDREGTLYFAELHGVVKFFSYNGPGRGFAGRVFPITMRDGSAIRLEGPFSSRAGVMNRQGFTPCLEVAVHSVHTRYGGCHMTVRKARQVLHKWGFAHWDLLPVIKFGSEPYWVLTHMAGRVPLTAGQVAGEQAVAIYNGE